jgi:glyceraldehyde 3-phosphate dehydrogenase
MLKVAINGYGRIGRLAHRILLERFTNEIELVAINAGSSTDIKGWMYLLKYDSAYGPVLTIDIKYEEAEREPKLKNLIGYLVVDGQKIPVISQKDATLLPWGELGVDVVIESTGNFETQEKLQFHINAGAKATVLSAPAKGGSVPTYVLGVNAQDYKGEKIISNASCTTNCIAPVAKVMVDNFGVEKAMMTTIHSYTTDQRLQDGGHKDYRRARAAASNMVPTSTGATVAAAEVITELKGIFAGLAIRVPIIVGSIADLTFVLKKDTTKEEVNETLTKAAQDPKLEGILAVSNEPIVSTDIIGNPYSVIVDLPLTQVVGNLVKIIAWYDNEYGYANRLVEQVVKIGSSLNQNPPQSAV